MLGDRRHSFRVSARVVTVKIICSHRGIESKLKITPIKRKRLLLMDLPLLLHKDLKHLLTNNWLFRALLFTKKNMLEILNFLPSKCTFSSFAANAVTSIDAIMWEKVAMARANESIGRLLLAVWSYLPISKNGRKKIKRWGKKTPFNQCYEWWCWTQPADLRRIVQSMDKYCKKQTNKQKYT